jgi:hypothetical protein
MTAFRRFTLSLGAAALLAPSLSFAAAPAPAPAPAPAAPNVPTSVDDVTCTLQLMFFVTEGRKVLADTAVPADKRIETATFLTLVSSALGFYEGRLAVKPPANFKAASEASFTRMKALKEDDMVNSTMGCVSYYQANENKLMDQMLGK